VRDTSTASERPAARAAAHWDRTFADQASAEQRNAYYALASPLYQKLYLNPHFSDDGAVQRVQLALRPGGTLVANEYVGPSRWQHTTPQLLLIKLLLTLLPRSKRRRPDGSVNRRPRSSGVAHRPGAEHQRRAGRPAQVRAKRAHGVPDSGLGA
jgi:hypothetical protein